MVRNEVPPVYRGLPQAGRLRLGYRGAVLFLIIGMLVISGCQVVETALDTAGVETGPEGDRASQSLGIVLFQDDFSDNNSGWTRVEDDTGTGDYIEGAYKFLIRSPNWYYWATPSLSFTDVRIETRASQITKAGTHVYGVICRYQNPSNFYFFTVTSDGFFAISKFLDGQEYLVGMETMESSAAILQGSATNHLGVECIGDRLSFYANGAHLGSVQDASFSNGDVGLIVSTLSDEEVVFEYDYFSVLSP